MHAQCMHCKLARCLESNPASNGGAVARRAASLVTGTCGSILGRVAATSAALECDRFGFATAVHGCDVALECIEACKTLVASWYWASRPLALRLVAQLVAGEHVLDAGHERAPVRVTLVHGHYGLGGKAAVRSAHLACHAKIPHFPYLSLLSRPSMYMHNHA